MTINNENAMTRTVILLTLFLVVVTTPFVFADTKEIGTDWVNEYSNTSTAECPHFEAEDLSYTDEDAGGWYDFMSDEGFTKKFQWGDNDSWESDFSSSDATYADSVDFVYFSGHGDNGEVTHGQPVFVFNEDHDSDSSDECEVHPSEANWGDGDLEWLFLSASKTLHSDFDQEWLDSFDNLHGMTGWHDSPSDSSTLGSRFACELTGGSYGSWNCSVKRTIGDAWQQATIQDESSTIAALLRGVIEVNSVEKDYWDEYADNMFQDPPNGSYVKFIHTKWVT